MDDLKLIKKHYGEDMMHLCRELFPTLLEEEGLLFKLISDNFAYSKLLYEDIIDDGMEEEFKDYIYSFIDVENNNEIITDKTPFELMKEAGYTLFECKSEEDIQKFKKYYKKGEELCTFRGHRLESCYVFFAVKDNVDQIKREDFDRPSRQDPYGTSVISIQFRRGEKNTVSIKNRYNHVVNNPDSTFHNNLDEINPGLTKSFEKQYNLNISRENDYDFELTNYLMDMDGKWFKYNYEINNICYGANNVIIDNFDSKQYDPAKILIIDYYIFDLENKTIKCYDKNIVDSFPYAFDKIDKMEINKLIYSKNKELKIYHDGVISSIVFDENNRMIELDYQGDMKEIEYFMSENLYLSKIRLENADKIGDRFLKSNAYNISTINLPNALSIGDGCLQFSGVIVSFKAPKVTDIGKGFMNNVYIIKELDLSSLENIGNHSIFEDDFQNILKNIKVFKISDKYKNLLPGGKKL